MKPLPAPSPGPRIRYYGCCRCQRNHYEGTAVYARHLWHQSKHGIQETGRALYFRGVAAAN